MAMGQWVWRCKCGGGGVLGLLDTIPRWISLAVQANAIATGDVVNLSLGSNVVRPSSSHDLGSWLRGGEPRNPWIMRCCDAAAECGDRRRRAGG